MTQAPTPGPLTAAIDMLSEARDFIDRFSDVIDGDYGTSEPNAAMVMVHEINATIDHLSAPTAPVEASGSERDIGGETFMGFRVAAWRYRQGDETEKLPHHYAEHWSTPGASAWGIQRLFTEDQLQQALNLHPQPSGETREDVARELWDYQIAARRKKSLSIPKELGSRILALLSARPPARAEGQDEGAAGWIVGNSEDNRWRSWDQGGPVWVDDRARATRYARREDAEAVHAEDEDAWCVKPYPSPTPARAEAQDEGTAGYLVALLASYCGDDTSGCTDETPCLDCVRMANVYKIPKTALGEFVGELGNIAAPYPSPTPAADADRVRIAVEALEPFANAATSAGRNSHNKPNLEREAKSAVSWLDFSRAAKALAALKSTAAKEKKTDV